LRVTAATALGATNALRIERARLDAVERELRDLRRVGGDPVMLDRRSGLDVREPRIVFRANPEDPSVCGAR
jgi:hypothetical protein